ncbi:MAG: hypothetical protein WC485_12655 [Opitutaceae bacterium]
MNEDQTQPLGSERQAPSVPSVGGRVLAGSHWVAIVFYGLAVTAISFVTIGIVLIAAMVPLPRETAAVMWVLVASVCILLGMAAARHYYQRLQRQ